MDDMVGTVFAHRAAGRPEPAHRVRGAGRGPRALRGLLGRDGQPLVRRRRVGARRACPRRGRHRADTRSAASARACCDDVIALQDALLPEWLPVLPGVEIAGRYLLAQAEESAGGDWYDAVGLAHGRVALVVGDVVGHGVAASAVDGTAAGGRAGTTEQWRRTCTASMRALDRFARQRPRCERGHRLRAGAGHRAPGSWSTARPDTRRPSSYAPTPAGRATCATAEPRRWRPPGEMTVAEDHVDCGDLVVLYTDGILARPGRSLASSTVELGQVAVDARRHRRPRADGSRRPGLRAGAGADDRPDGVRRRHRAAGRRGHRAAGAAAPGPAGRRRTPCRSSWTRSPTWLESMRVRDLDHIVVQHAVDELVTNVVEHAYAQPPAAPVGSPSTPPCSSPATCEIRFADSGRWLEPRRRSRDAVAA